MPATDIQLDSKTQYAPVPSVEALMHEHAAAIASKAGGLVNATVLASEYGDGKHMQYQLELTAPALPIYRYILYRIIHDPNEIDPFKVRIDSGNFVGPMTGRQEFERWFNKSVASKTWRETVRTIMGWAREKQTGLGVVTPPAVAPEASKLGRGQSKLR